MENTIKELLGLTWLEKLHTETNDYVNSYLTINTDKGKFFVKWNNLKQSKTLYDTEYHGLKLLEKLGIIRTPKVYLTGCVPGSDLSFIVLEYLDNLQPLGTCAKAFAGALAKIHTHNINLTKNPEQSDQAVTKFGCDKEVFFGPHFHIPAGTWYDKWHEYLTNEIFQPQFEYSELVKEDTELQQLWSQMKPVVKDFFQGLDIVPSLLVSDLGSDNAGQVNGQPVIFDPYCFYGHYEFELTQPYLIKDFTPDFFESYYSVMPKEPGYDRRRLLYQLFGCMIRHNYGKEGYLDKAKETMKSLL